MFRSARRAQALSPVSESKTKINLRTIKHTGTHVSFKITVAQMISSTHRYLWLFILSKCFFFNF